MLWLLVLALIAALLLIGARWRHPTVFPGAGGWGMSSRNFALGEPLYVGMSYEKRGQSGTATIRDVTANVVRNSSHATIEFFVCTVNTSSGIETIGSVDGDGIHDFCLTLEPAAGREIKLNADPRQQVVMALTNMDPGRVKIVGMDLSYSHGWQRGTQLTGGTVVLASRTPRS